jgi:GH25 family lysozyme M1 (1,4-beta-N-acetylmuramidase)
VNFADLSHHQTAFDVEAYAKHRPRIALKATEGDSFIDPRFNERWRAAGSHNLERIAYHYHRVAADPVVQWHRLWATVQNAGGLRSGDRICLDVEDTAGSTNNVLSGSALSAQRFCEAAVNAGVMHGLIYSGNWYLRPNGITASRFPAGWRHLWISEYSDKADAAITVPLGWSREMIVARQYTAHANVVGVSGPCDDSRVLNDWLPPVIPPTSEAEMTEKELREAIREELAAFKKQHLDGTLLRVRDLFVEKFGADAVPGDYSANPPASPTAADNA